MEINFIELEELCQFNFDVLESKMVVIQSVEVMVLLDSLKDVASILLSRPIVTTRLVFACTTFL